MERINDLIKVNTLVLETQHTQNYGWMWVIPVSTEKVNIAPNNSKDEVSVTTKVKHLWDNVGIVKDSTNYEELIEDGKEY